jgi:hypothetical protein
MTLRLGFREGLTGDTAVIAKEIINTAAERARIIFEELGRNWAALVGGSAVGEEATVALEG